MTAVILEFKRPSSLPTNSNLCCQCGKPSTHYVELVNIDMNSVPTFVGYKYFCDACDIVQAGD